MPNPPLPPRVEALVRQPNEAVVASIRPDGTPHTAATWYDWEDGRILLNMDAGRRRLDFMRRDPRVSLTVLADGNWYRHITARGRGGGDRRRRRAARHRPALHPLPGAALQQSRATRGFPRGCA